MSATSESKKQINLRISPRAYRILETAVYAESAGSVPKLLEPIIEKYAEQRFREAKIERILRASEEKDSAVGQ